jgi:hypothetical protein
LLLQESTLDAQLLSSSSRSGSGGALLYDYEYSLDSTRGLKRILNTVTITGEGCRRCQAPRGFGQVATTSCMLLPALPAHDPRPAILLQLCACHIALLIWVILLL